MEALSETEIAYVACLIDVHARIRVQETPDGTSLPFVHVSSPNFPMLSYLGSLTGITPFVTKRSYDKHRCSEHCDKAHDHVVSSSGRWSISGAKATVVLAAVSPHARFQKTQIEEALAVGLGAPKKKATPLKMKQLGWPIPEEWN